MNRTTSLLLAVLGTAAIAAPPANAQRCPPGDQALVLSGGGARGLAHVGVLRVLDSLGYRPDYVVGTSIGSIIGALVATGYDARQTDSIVRALDVASVLSSANPLAPRAFGFVEPILVWEQGRGGLGVVSASTLDMRINARLNDAMLVGNLTAAGDFDSLPVPFTAIATDLRNRDRVLLTNGDLARAVRASMSIPIVFYPQVLGGRILVDGGIVDNIPTGPARQRATTLAVVDISSAAADSLDINSPTAIASQLYELFLRETGDETQPHEVFVRPDLAGIGLLDFSTAKMTLAEERGAEAARAAVRDWACRPPPREHVRVPRGPFRLASVTITAPRPADRRFIQREFGLVPGDTLDLARIRRAYRGMEQSAERREIWLNPRRTPEGLHLDVALTPPPRRKGGIAFVYDYDMGGRLAAALLDRTLFDGSVQGSAAFLLGRYRQQLNLGLRPEPVSWNPVQPDLRLLISREDVRRYDREGLELASADTRDASVNVGLEQASGDWVLGAWALAGSWTDTTGTVSATGLRIRATSGNASRLPTLTVDAAWTSAWSLAMADAEAAVRVGPWTVSGAARVGAGDRLPLQLTLPLGGARGFPGYYVYELRGDAELFGEVAVEHRVLGPFRGRVEAAGGRIWQSAEESVLGGARLLAVLGTPVGELRGGYGWATTGRHNVFVRLGAWF